MFARPSSRSSFASTSSCNSHFAESIFSEVSEVSTCESSIDNFSVDLQNVRAAIRTQTVHLPLRLPPPPAGVREVNIDALTLDQGLDQIPLDFIIKKMEAMGPALLHSSVSTTIHLPEGPELPSHIRCTHPPTLSNHSIPNPTHLLAIQSPGTQRRLLVPVHGLSWALRCSNLSILSSSSDRQPPTLPLPKSFSTSPPETDDRSSIYLPVVPIQLPCAQAFPLLQTWIYLQSPAHLLSSILPSQPQSSTNKPSLANLLHPTFTSLSEDLSQLSVVTLLDAVKLLHGLWQNVVALGILEERLWSTMHEGWSVLVAALARKESERRVREG